MKANKLLLAVVVACAIAAPRDPGTRTGPMPIEGELPSLGGATGWLNSPPLTPDGLRGRVVLIAPGRILILPSSGGSPLCPRVGREIQGSGFGRDRRALS